MSIKEALNALERECHKAGRMDADENSDGDALFGVEVDAAEDAVLALYEKQKAIADELAEILEQERAYSSGRGVSPPNYDRMVAALAAYNKAKEG